MSCLCGYVNANSEQECCCESVQIGNDQYLICTDSLHITHAYNYITYNRGKYTIFLIGLACKIVVVHTKLIYIRIV